MRKNVKQSFAKALILWVYAAIGLFSFAWIYFWHPVCRTEPAQLWASTNAMHPCLLGGRWISSISLVCTAPRPRPTRPTSLPTETEPDLSYLDYAYAQGFFDDPMNVIVPSYEAGEAYGANAFRAYQEELAYIESLSPVERAEYQPTCHMLMFSVNAYWVEDFGNFAICHFSYIPD